MTRDQGVPRERRLILMRHGHAQSHSDDYERLLSEHGRAAARGAGAALKAHGLVPERIITSSAPRARQTAELVAEACGYDGGLQAERSLYLAAREQLLAPLRSVRAGVGSVLLVGHNPGLSGLARELGGQRGALAPAEYVVLRLELHLWSEL